MSKYPNNPYWCDEHDRPRAILSRSEWDEARRLGYLTDEHNKSRPNLKLRMDLRTGELLGIDDRPPGIRRQLHEARQFVRSHHDLLMARWAEVEAARPAHG